MEHIGEILGSLDSGKPIPSLKIIKLTLGEKREELRKSLGVSSLENTLENFKPVAGTEKALAAFKALVGGKTNWKMLLVYGGVGNGKSHLCEATAIALHKKGIFCRVMVMDRMMGVLKECIGSNQSLEELLNNYCHAERLIIDDVEGTVWEFEQLEKIIRVRYRENLFTILTTNRDIKPNPQNPQEPFIPERVVSRFRDPDVGRVILNSGADFRRLK